MSTASVKIENECDEYVINEFEYFEIYKTCEHIAFLYEINEIDADFLKTMSLNEYIKEKENGKIQSYIEKKFVVDENIEKKLIKGYIRVLVKNNALNMFRKRNAKYMPKIYTESSLISTDEEGNEESIFDRLASGKDSLDEIFTKDIQAKLYYIYQALSPKEREIYEFLEDGKDNGKQYKPKEVCEILNISKEEYEKFIDKLKLILNNVYKINESNYEDFLPKR